MRMVRRSIVLAALLAAPVAAPEAATAAPPPSVSVRFSAALESRLEGDYGAAERETLRALAVEAVTRALVRVPPAALPPGSRAEVVIDDAEPSHPTRRQALATPSIDPLRSKSLGGATLSGTVLAADGRPLATASLRHYATDFALASPGGDPWADARVTIDRFAAVLAARLHAAH